MCRVPDQEDAKYKDDEDAYEDDLDGISLCLHFFKKCRQRLMPSSPRSSPTPST